MARGKHDAETAGTSMLGQIESGEVGSLRDLPCANDENRLVDVDAVQRASVGQVASSGALSQAAICVGPWNQSIVVHGRDDDFFVERIDVEATHGLASARCDNCLSFEHTGLSVPTECNPSLTILLHKRNRDGVVRAVASSNRDVRRNTRGKITN